MDDQKLIGDLKLQLETTGRFVPAAFHVHSIDSHDWASRDGVDKAVNAAELFKDARGVELFLDELAKHLRIACITDHMKCAYACKLAKASLERKDILVLPAMEVSCEVEPFAQTIHLLTIFPPGTDPGTFEKLFSEHPKFPTEAQRHGKERVRLKNLKDWIEMVGNEGGIVVLAHIEGDAGHRQVVRAAFEKNLLSFQLDARLITKSEKQVIAETYASVLARAKPHAVEIMNPEDKVHYVSFKHGDGELCRMACVVRSDFHSLEELSRTDCHTYLKVSRLNFESVRDAFSFFETRVRFQHDLPTPSYPRIVGISFTSPANEGLFPDSTIAFNENLSCLIGPRGSGKSTVIEGMRYVLGSNLEFERKDEWATDQPAKIAQQIQAANLKGTLIKLVYKTDEETHHILSVTYDSRNSTPTVQVLDKDGIIVPVSPTVLSSKFPVRIYSWSQVESLGRKPESQRALVDRLIPSIGNLLEEKSGHYRNLVENGTDIHATITRLTSKLQEQSGIARRYKEYKAEFESVNTPEVSQRFEGLDRARKQVEILREALECVERLTADTDRLSSEDVTNFTSKVDDEALRKWWIEQVEPVVKLTKLGVDVNHHLASIRVALQERVTALRQQISDAEATVASLETQIRKLTQVTPEAEISRDRREQARVRYVEASRVRDEYLVLWNQLEDFLADRESILAKIEDVHKRLAEERASCRQELLKKLQELPDVSLNVEIDFEEGGDRQDAINYMEEKQFLRREFAGQYKNTGYARRLCTMATPANIGRSLLVQDQNILEQDKTQGDDKRLTTDEITQLMKHYCPVTVDVGVDAKVVDTDKMTVVLELQQIQWNDTVRILLDGDPVDMKSPGQRSSAMLPLVALSENIPLVIDQPEDNLDNRLVGQVLTQIFARLKEVRQIIVATHSPNIVVGGDAEQVAVLDAEGVDKAKLVATGSIDDPDIIRAVISIMEGGKEAFEARGRRYQPHLC